MSRIITNSIWLLFFASLTLAAFRFIDSAHIPAALITATQSTSTPEAVIASEPQEDTSIATQLSELTLTEKVGQMFMIGHWDENDFYHTTNLLRAYDFGGVIIMKVSPKNSDFVPVWSEHWREDSVIAPPFIAIDQEGGVVSRLRGPEHTTTAQRDLSSVEHAYAVGADRGAELAARGITVNLAPVLDTSVTPSSFLYERTFADPSEGTALARSLIRGHGEQGVLTAIKHYPGHDDTVDDSHFVLPVVAVAAADFSTFTKPFIDTITTTRPHLVMTAHVLVPSLDPVYPATLSPEILTNQLRNNVGFSGLIMTDDMTMGAITNTWSTKEATIQAITAGADIILFAAEPDASIDALTAVVAAVESGQLSEARIDESVTRILEVKSLLE